MTTMEYSRVAQTYGALLIGGFIAAFLSGILLMQCFLYLKLFPKDQLRLKVTVCVIWVLDQAHSIMVYTSIWRYIIKGFGNVDEMDVISPSLALTVLLTGCLTFIVHCFFAHRIHRLSNRDWRLTGIIATLAVCRISASAVTTAEMIHMETLSAFKASFGWLFTLGLALSCAEDIFIASLLVCSLRSLQRISRISSNLDRVVGSVILYTLETNSLTGTWTIVCMICWLAMPNNLVFMASHFFICKLYGNSLLAILNARKLFQTQRERDVTLTFPPFSRAMQYSPEPPLATKIFIEHTVEYSSESTSEGRVPRMLPSPRINERVTS